MPELSPPGLLRLGFHLDDRHLSHRPTKRKFVLLGERELCGPRTSHWRWMALRNVTRDCMCTWPTVQPRWRPVKLRLLYSVPVRSRQEQVVTADYLFFPSQVQICLIQPGPIGCRDPLRATCSKTYCTGRCVVGKSTRELYKFTNK